jgi:serine/threonine-protein kinase RsbW/stage II sporulation protein AB (anti-sigma F factor)
MVRRELGRALESAGVDASRRYDIALVMTEAASNAVLHAYPPLQPPGLLFVDAGIAGHNLLLRVCDCGRGMGPRPDSPGFGVGLSLVSRLADGLEIAPNRTVGGTRVSAMFRDVTSDGHALRIAARRADDEMLREYLEMLEATADGADGRGLLLEAQRALGHADHLRSERLL